MKFQSYLAFALCGLFLNTSLAHKNSAVESAHYQQTQISDSLTLLSSKGDNIIVSQGEDGLLLIDNGYNDLAHNLKSILDNFKGAPNLEYVINTHWHFDHTGGNQVLGGAATIIAHDSVRSRLENPSEIPFFNYQSQAHPEQALPTLTYPDAMRIHFNKDELHLQHFPNSHTDGDTVIFFKEANLVHMGDLMFHPYFPFIDIHNGGHAIHFLNSIQKINSQIDSDTIVIPGHGAMTNKQGLTAFQNMLEQTILEVKDMKHSGMSLSAIQKKGLDKKWQAWGTSFINEASWISFIYESL